MKKTYVFLLSCLLTVTSVMQSRTTKPQPEAFDDRPPVGLNKIPQRAERLKSFSEKNGPLSRIMNRTAQKSSFKSRVVSAPYAPLGAINAPMKSTSGTGRELWGNVAYQTGWSSSDNHYGLYSFAAQNPLTVNKLFENPDMIANGGAALIDQTYHAMYLDTRYAEWNYIYLYHSAYNTETGEVEVKKTKVKDLSMAAAETAVDNATGTVYGAFFTSDMNGFELGVADYSTMKRTTIGPLKKSYAALGVTKEGSLYGVASDGNLYKIDRATAKETLVGPTGLTISNANGKYYGQSGEIDQTTDIFYWAAVMPDSKSALYTVDLTNGAATKIADFSADEQIYGLTVPQPAAADGAPAKAEDVTATFDGGNTSGTLTFRAPEKTYGGSKLDNNAGLDYRIFANDVLKTQGKVKPGQVATVQLDDVTEGKVKFVVVLSNEAGDGPKASVSRYVGFGVPKTVSSLNFTLDKKTRKVVVTWKASSGLEDGGFLGNLSYDIVRHPDSITVAHGTTDTTFIETLPETELKAWYYGVTAVNGTKRSKEMLTKPLASGSAIIPPYLETFDDKNSMTFFTVLDNNGDGRKWGYNSAQNAAYIFSSKNGNADDWLITPALKVEKGKIYTIAFKTWISTTTFPESLEVKWGFGDTTADMKNTLLEDTTLTEKKNYVFTKTIVADRTGEINIGFHCISDPKTSNMFCIDSISVSAGRSSAVPSAVTKLKVTPDSTGERTATIVLTAPTKDHSGNDMASLTKIEVIRDGNTVKTFDSPKPGSKLTFEDSVELSRSYSYTAVAYNAAGAGDKAETVTVYIGEDRPQAPTDVTAADNANSIRIAWKPSPAVGATGGIVKPENRRSLKHPWNPSPSQRRV